MNTAFTILSRAVIVTLGMTSAAIAEPQNYVIDSHHSQVLFSFNHHGFSGVSGLLTGITGMIVYDREAPASSSVVATIPLSSLTTGHAEQDADILSPDFLDPEKSPEVTLRSVSIEVVGVDHALITGALSLNGMTKKIVLDTVLNKDGPAMAGTPTLGLEATVTLLRSDFGAGRSAPNNSDAVQVHLSLEATKSDKP
ncbi:MAG TPA: YceI family protein [Paenirhodobacter sp.]